MGSCVSVVTPIYNTEVYLERCVQSIRNQTYKEIELILSDDGSADESGSLCDEFALIDERLIVIHKKNGGQSEARNYALDLISGDYLYFCDSDDWIESDLVEHTVRSMKDNNVDLVRFQSFIHDTSGCMQPTSFEFHDNILPCENKFELLYYYILNYKMGYELCYSLYKSEQFLIHKIRFPSGINVAEDLYVLILYILNSEKIFLLNKPLYHYWIHGNSTMRLSHNTCMLNQYNTLAKYIYDKSDDTIKDYFFLMHSKLICGELQKICDGPSVNDDYFAEVFDAISYLDFYRDSCKKMIKFGKKYLIEEYGYYIGMNRFIICKFAVDHSITRYNLRKMGTEVLWFPVRVKNKIIKMLKSVRYVGNTRS